MSQRVLSCHDCKVSWLHDDDRFDDERWDPDAETGRAAFLRAKCPYGHFASAHVGYLLKPPAENVEAS